jgi:membrane protease YdiL (CAAX protease family)
MSDPPRLSPPEYEPSEPLTVLPADLEPIPARPALPQPGFWLAVALSLLLVISQLIIAVVVLTVMLVAAGAAPVNVKELTGSALLILASTAATTVVAVGIAVVFHRSQTRRRLALRGFHPFQFLVIVLLALPLQVVAGATANLVADGLFRFEGFREFYEMQSRFFQDFSREFWLLVILGGCLLPGLGEEIFYRGLVSRGVVARNGVVFGTILTALLFGLVHIEPIQASGAALIGIGFQVVFLTTRSLLAPIFLHALNNGLAFVAMRWLAPGTAEPLAGLGVAADHAGRWLGGGLLNPAEKLALFQLIDRPPWLVTLTAVAAVAALFLLLYEMRTRWRLPDGTPWSPGYVTAEMPPASLGAVTRLETPSLWTVLVALAALGTFVFVLVDRVEAAAG